MQLLHQRQLEWSETITMFYAIGGGIHHADVRRDPAFIDPAPRAGPASAAARLIQTLLIQTFARAPTKSLHRQ